MHKGDQVNKSYRGPGKSGSGRNSNRDNKPGAAVARQLKDMPDYSNSATKETEKKLGKFDYDQPPSPSAKNLIERGPYELDNGAIYVGEWTKDGLRHGKGL